MSTTDNLAIGLIAVNQKQKEVIANEGIAALEAKITESVSINVIDGTNTVTAAQVRENAALVLAAGSPAPTAAFALSLPAVKNALLVRNDTAQQANIACTGGALVYALSAGAMALLYCDGIEAYGVAGGSGGSGATAFTGLTDVPASYTTHSGKLVRVASDESGLEFAELPFDIGGWVPGTIANSQIMFRVVVPRDCVLPSTMTGSYCEALTAATAETVFTVKQNDVSIGTVTFAASGTDGTLAFDSDTVLASGDGLSMHAPATADATLADISFAFAGRRV